MCSVSTKGLARISNRRHRLGESGSLGAGQIAAGEDLLLIIAATIAVDITAAVGNGEVARIADVPGRRCRGLSAQADSE